MGKNKGQDGVFLGFWILHLCGVVDLSEDVNDVSGPEGQKAEVKDVANQRLR